MKDSYRIAVLISGSGTTLKNLIHFQHSGQLDAEIALVISNNRLATGLDYAATANIETSVIDHSLYPDISEFSQLIFDACRSAKVDLIVMGGFLRRLSIPDDFANRVVNIHPSLIPAFCGKGNYGRRVHQAVLDYGCKLSGCTVHYVDEQYDHGPIIAQRSVPVVHDDTPDSLAARVFEQECQLYPQVINLLARGAITVSGRNISITTE